MPFVEQELLQLAEAQPGRLRLQWVEASQHPSLPRDSREENAFSEEDLVGLDGDEDLDASRLDFMGDTFSQKVFVNREQSRDEFLGLLRSDWEQLSQDEHHFQASVAAITGRLEGCNRAWFAKLFVHSLLEQCWVDTSWLRSADARIHDALSKDPVRSRKLEKLNQRLHSPGSGVEQFFRLFLKSPGLDHSLCSLITARLSERILLLSSPSATESFVANSTLTARVIKLRLLARCLGLLTFDPLLPMTKLDEHHRHLCTNVELKPMIDVVAILRHAQPHSMLVSVAWICDFLNEMGSCLATTASAYYSEAFLLLAQTRRMILCWKHRSFLDEVTLSCIEQLKWPVDYELAGRTLERPLPTFLWDAQAVVPFSSRWNRLVDKCCPAMAHIRSMWRQFTLPTGQQRATRRPTRTITPILAHVPPEQEPDVKLNVPMHSLGDLQSASSKHSKNNLRNEFFLQNAAFSAIIPFLLGKIVPDATAAALETVTCEVAELLCRRFSERVQLEACDADEERLDTLMAELRSQGEKLARSSSLQQGLADVKKRLRAALEALSSARLNHGAVLDQATSLAMESALPMLSLELERTLQQVFQHQVQTKLDKTRRAIAKALRERQFLASVVKDSSSTSSTAVAAVSSRKIVNQQRLVEDGASCFQPIPLIIAPAAGTTASGSLPGRCQSKFDPAS